MRPLSRNYCYGLWMPCKCRECDPREGDEAFVTTLVVRPGSQEYLEACGVLPVDQPYELELGEVAP